MTKESVLAYAKEVFEIEALVIAQLSDQLDAHFPEAVNAVLNTKGKLVVTGMGKSGLIGKKIAATLASTGTPSFFLHPGEAFHGDLGMVTKDDIVLLLSNSGETREVLNILPYFIDNGNVLISITGAPNSTLAKHSTYHLCAKVDKEACPLDLAPTSSTTACLVMGDALAVALMKERKFKPENFARFHPGGSLGKQLLTRVKDVMRVNDLPIVSLESSITEVVTTVSEGKLGLAVVLKEGLVQGIITDGDIRRAMANTATFFQLSAKHVMSAGPKTILPTAKLNEADALMNSNKITALIVAESQKLRGVVQIYDLL
jgi:arabinose-5-phosphate isomerase